MMDESAGAFEYAVRVCCASASLAERIDETDGRLASGSVDVVVEVAALPLAPDELLVVDDEPVDAVELEADEVVDATWLAASDPGVPSSCAA